MNRACSICGRPLLPRRGRPSDYCSPPEGKERSDCSRLAERFDEIRTYAQRIASSLEGDAPAADEFSRKLMTLRSSLWREANVATNLGRLRGQVNRKRYPKRRDGWWRASECDILPGMNTVKISCYESDREAVLSAILPYGRPERSEVVNGFLFVTGEVSDPEALETAARDAGAFSVVFEAEKPEEVPPAEVLPEVLVVEDPSPEVVAPTVAPEPIAFVARFPSPEEGLRFASDLAGLVDFAEPPTGWEGDRWCVRGIALSLDPVHALAAYHGGAL